MKSTERPPAEFWDKSDRELRAKQLAALVQKRPWWQRLPNVFAGWRRYPLPLGAAAALAMAFVSVREFSHPAAVPAPESEGRLVATSSSAPRLAEGPVALSAAPRTISDASRALSDAAPAVAVADNPAVSEEPASPAVGSVAPGEVARMVNHLPSAEAVAEGALAPSARHIAANLAAATQAGEGLIGGGLLDASRSRAGASRAAVEPLAQVNPPSGARLAKFRSAMAVSVAQVSFARGDERVVRDLNDRLNEEAIRRITAKGNELSMKF